MEEILKKVYSEFGDDLPKDRSAYGAIRDKAVSVLQINKAFKSWKLFAAQYTKYAIAQRNKQAKKVVTKETSKETTKNVSK